MKQVVLTAVMLTITAVVSVWLFSLSAIPGMIFLILTATSFLSVLFARPVIKVSIKAEKQNDSVRMKGTLKDVETELNKENGYQAEINFSDFLESSSLTLSLESMPQPRIYDRNGNIKIHVSRSLFGIVRCEIRNEKNRGILKEYLHFSPRMHQRSNKVMTFLLTFSVIGMAVVFCMLFHYKYMNTRASVQETLNQNLTAVVSGSPIMLKEEPFSAEQMYHPELPDVHLLVIRKEQNTFTDPQNQYYHPEIVNTVLMLYEDNLSGKRNVQESSFESETLPEVVSVQKLYYNITELYLNIPVILDEDSNQQNTLGELFSGAVAYQGLSGYDAVRTWFREVYHIRIASVTELPETLFSGCFGTENFMSVNLNQDFVRFLYDNYCSESGNKYSTFSVREMLSEHRPEFSETLRQNTEELSVRLGVRQEDSTARNAMLMLNGDSVAVFGNTVRMWGDSEYDYLLKKGYYADKTAFPDSEWDSVSLNAVVHSNWDIVLVDFLESLSNMNNSTYQIFCCQNHADILHEIRTSLPPEELKQFLESLCRANNVLGNDDETQNQYLFYVRNLNFNTETVLGESNLYLRKEALPVKPYTNRRVKKSLYYCLEEAKSANS